MRSKSFTSFLLRVAKVPGNESSWERKFHVWNFRFWGESTWERKFLLPLTFHAGQICQLCWHYLTLIKAFYWLHYSLSFSIVSWCLNLKRSVLGVDRRSRTSEQKITSVRSPLYLITFITLCKNAAIFLHCITRTVVRTEISVILLSITKFIQKQYIFKSMLQRNRYGLKWTLI